MNASKEVEAAAVTLKSMCSKTYREDEYGDIQCLDCPFYRISDGGYSHCHLTWDDEYLPKHWGV